MLQMSFAALCFTPRYATFWPPERSSHFAVVEEVVAVEKDDDVDSGKSPDCKSSWLIASLLDLLRVLLVLVTAVDQVKPGLGVLVS